MSILVFPPDLPFPFVLAVLVIVLFPGAVIGGLASGSLDRWKYSLNAALLAANIFWVWILSVPDKRSNTSLRELVLMIFAYAFVYTICALLRTAMTWAVTRLRST